MDRLPRSSANIRETLGRFVGKTIVDITENDPNESETFVELLFDNGETIRFPVTDRGFDFTADVEIDPNE